MRVLVQSAPFDIGAESVAFTKGAAGAGAIVTFTGIVRDLSGGLAAMEIEHYPGMTERAISGLVAEAAERADHHPDIDIRWRTVTFTLVTHSQSGITAQDVELARAIDDLLSNLSR